MKKYFYYDGNEKHGPFSFEELKNENIDKSTLIWSEGLDDWKPAGEIKELEEILQLIPPPIVPNEAETRSESTEPEEKNKDKEIHEDEPKQMSFEKQGMFSMSFSFEGRIRRMEYGISFIIYVILQSIVNVVLQSSPDASIIILVDIPLLWFIWAQGAKRCHDLGHSGWYQIIPFYVLWLLFADGVRMTNEYGANPKG